MPLTKSLSSYKQYKDDTNFIASWLATSSRQCGYPSHLLNRKKFRGSTAPKLKGRARKLARDAAGAEAKQGSSKPSQEALPAYIIAREDFTKLADYVVASNTPVVQVPPAVIFAINRAIKLRKCHASLWAEKESDQNCQSNATHEHFISVLEKVRETLSLRCTPQKVVEQETIVDDASFANKFASLLVEEPSVAFTDVKPAASSSKKKNSQPVPIYVAEEDVKNQEKLLATLCLVEDIYDIRNFIKKLWLGFLYQHFDLRSCALSTNTAIKLVGRIQRDYEDAVGTELDYQALAYDYYITGCKFVGANPFGQSPGDLINFEVAGCANLVMLTTCVLLRDLKKILREENSFILALDTLETYDPSSDRSKMTARQQYEEDKTVLCEAFQDLVAFAAASPCGSTSEDEFTRTIRELKAGGPVNLCGVFAAQTYLDINHLLRSSTKRPFIELQVRTRRMKQTIEQSIEYHRTSPYFGWSDKHDAMLQIFMKYLDCIINRDVVLECFQNMNMTEYPPLFRFMKRNPIFCGMKLLHLDLKMHYCGTSFAELSGSVIFMAHLYNALEKEKLLTQTWSDMEYLIDLHAAEQWFVGGRSSTTQEYSKKYLLMAGVAAHSFAKNRREGPGVKTYTYSQKGAKDMKRSTTPTCDLFLTALEDVTQGADELLKIERFFATRPATFGADPKGQHSQKAKQGMEPLELLELLFDEISTELPALQFNYFGMHERCWTMLKIIDEHLKDDLEKHIDMFDQNGIYPLPSLVGDIFEIEEDRRQLARERRIDVSTLPHDVFPKAAEKLNEFLGTDSSHVETAKMGRNASHHQRFAAVNFIEETQGQAPTQR